MLIGKLSGLKKGCRTHPLFWGAADILRSTAQSAPSQSEGFLCFMRDIKFRVWNGKEMFYGWGCFTNESNKQFVLTDDNKYMGILMQYTGLTDKNGKEIYEGDWVYCEDYPGEIRSGVVEWVDQWGFWNITLMEDGLGDVVRDMGVEVIGNIYKNPELLKAKT